MIVNEGYRLNQMRLVTDIMAAISNQVPVLPGEPRFVNCVIAAASSICAELAKPIVKTAPGMGLEAWLNSDDTGASSLYMAWVLSNAQFGLWYGRSQPKKAYPHDPDDFGRCRRLLLAVPGYAISLYRMSEHGKEWAAIVDNWDRWVAMYDDENDDGSQLYAEMKAAYSNEGKAS